MCLAIVFNFIATSLGVSWDADRIEVFGPDPARPAKLSISFEVDELASRGRSLELSENEKA